MRRRPAFLTIFHTTWLTIASALLLAGCTVVPAPTSYSYQPIACPPGVGPQAAAPTQAPPAPPPDGTIPAPQGVPQATPASPPGAPAGQCYAAVPNDYAYAAYPGYAYPYPYPYAPYYGPYPYGYWSGGIFFYGHRHHW